MKSFQNNLVMASQVIRIINGCHLTTPTLRSLQNEMAVVKLRPCYIYAACATIMAHTYTNKLPPDCVSLTSLACQILYIIMFQFPALFLIYILRLSKERNTHFQWTGGHLELSALRC